MPYMVEVRVEISEPGFGTRFEWIPLGSSPRSEPYVYRYRDEAEQVRRMCYPNHLDETRVVETNSF